MGVGGGASHSEGGLGFFDMLLEYDRAEEEERFVFVSQLTEVQRYVSMSPCVCTYTSTYRICSELGHVGSEHELESMPQQVSALAAGTDAYDLPTCFTSC